MHRGGSGGFAALQQQQQRWLREVEASELLTHDSDVTEATATGADETAAWAYGGDYYLQEQHLGKLARLHSSSNSNNKKTADDDTNNNSSSSSNEASKRMRGLVVNTSMAQPRFFASGNDFPAVVTHNNNNNKDEDEAAVTAAALWSVASGTDMNIIVPVVSSSCALAVSASNGSTALAELKRLLAREKANKAAADTSKSQLTQLLRKDALGRTCEQTSGGTVGSDGVHDGAADEAALYGSLALASDRRGRAGGGGGDADEEQEQLQRAADEAALLRRRLRIERERLALDDGTGTTAAGGRLRDDDDGDDDDDGSSGNAQQQRRLRKLARLEQIASAEAAAEARNDDLATASSGSAIDGVDNDSSSGGEHDEVVARRAQMRAQQRALPIYACKDALLRCIGENAVTVVVGETGSGKTTQLVQYLYEHGYAHGSGRRIGCTQPRRLAAVGVARRVSEEMGCVLGGLVGYAIHLDDMTSASTAIKFMTDGVLLREVVHDADVSAYGVIVLDEAHERSVDTDVLMGVLKRAVCRRGGALKLIVTSATMDVDRFSRFFAHAPHFHIAGRTFPVTVHYAPAPVSDYVAEAVFRVCQLHIQAPLCGRAGSGNNDAQTDHNNKGNDNKGDEEKHDILVFMTGADDVYGTCELIRRRLRELDPALLDTLLLVPCLSEAAAASASRMRSNSTVASASAGSGGGRRAMTSSTTFASAQAASVSVLDPTPPGKRKCVVATNVAETSLTIDGVRYVVDCGMMKTNVFRPKVGMNTLQRYPVSQAQAQQRAGRAGRTCAGLCYRLYTEAQFAHEMLVSSVPEIQRSSVESVVLLLKSIGVRRLVDFDFMDAPPVANVRSSMWHLWMLRLLDDDGDITARGRLALEFPVAPPLAAALVHGSERGCGVEVARVVAVVAADAKNLFEVPPTAAEEAARQHSYFAVAQSDHLTLLNVLTQFLAHAQSRTWAQDHYLHTPTLLRACDVLQQLIERMHRLRLPVTSCRRGTHHSRGTVYSPSAATTTEGGGSGNNMLPHEDDRNENDDNNDGSLDVVRYCICHALCTQAAQRSSSGGWNEYRPLINAGVTCQLHPSSALCNRVDTPPYLVYHDLLLLNAKEYLVLATAVEPEWLIECSRGLYTPRRGVLHNNSSSSSSSSSSSGMCATSAMAAVAAAAAATTTTRPTGHDSARTTTTTTAARTASGKPRFASLSQRRRDNV